MLARDTRVIPLARTPTNVVSNYLDKLTNYHITSPAIPVSITGEFQYDNPNLEFPDTIFGLGYAATWTVHIRGNYFLSPNDLGVAFSGHCYLTVFSQQSPDFGASVASNDGDPVPVSVDYTFDLGGTAGNVDLICQDPGTHVSFWTAPDGYFVYFAPDITITASNIHAVPTEGDNLVPAIAIAAPTVRNSNRVEPIKMARQSVKAVPICD